MVRTKMQLRSAMKIPRITLRRVALLTALLLLVNSMALWSAAWMWCAKRMAVFEQKLNITDPRMQDVYGDVKSMGAHLCDQVFVGSQVWRALRGIRFYSKLTGDGDGSCRLLLVHAGLSLPLPSRLPDHERKIQIPLGTNGRELQEI